MPNSSLRVHISSSRVFNFAHSAGAEYWSASSVSANVGVDAISTTSHPAASSMAVISSTV